MASIPILANTASRQVRAATQMNFHFTLVCHAKSVANVQHTLALNGEGKFSGQEIVGGGTYNHFDNATPPPRTLISYGTLEASRLVDFISIGSWGVTSAGVLDMEVRLIQQFASAAVIPATLKVICNLNGGALINRNPNPPPPNLPEGAILTIPDAEFGPFTPLDPPIGFTAFSSDQRVEDRALDDTMQQLQTTRTLYLPTVAIIPSVIAGGLALAWAKARRKHK